MCLLRLFYLNHTILLKHLHYYISVLVRLISYSLTLPNLTTFNVYSIIPMSLPILSFDPYYYYIINLLICQLCLYRSKHMLQINLGKIKRLATVLSQSFYESAFVNTSTMNIAKSNICPAIKYPNVIPTRTIVFVLFFKYVPHKL